MGIAKDIEAQIDDQIKAHVEGLDQPAAPGVAISVTKDGKEIFADCYGLAEINHAVPVSRDTVMRIGSQTKQFTVLLILMLEADGKLSLEDPLRDHLPWLPEVAEPVKLVHLAANMSGFRDFLEAMAFSGRSIFSQSERQTARDALARQDALNFEPGSAMIYSNSGFLLLSDIIEKLEDASFDEVLKRRITGPLGMSDTHLMVRDGEARERLAAHYTLQDGSWRQAAWGVPLGGEGGMISTLNDMCLWQRALESGDTPWASLWRRMETPAVYRNRETAPYGLGLVVGDYRGRLAIGHGGSVAGGRSESMRFPDDGLGIVIQANHDQIATFSLARRIADVVFGDTPPVADIPAAAGFYRQENGNGVFEIIKRDEGSFLRSPDGELPLLAEPDGRFKPERGIADLLLSPRPDGSLDGLWCGAPRRFRKLEPCKADRSLSGRYVNHAQGIDAIIEGETGHAQLRLRSDLGVLDGSIEPLDRDIWLMRPDGQRPDGGSDWIAALTATSSGFVLDSERTRGLAFEKQ